MVNQTIEEPLDAYWLPYTANRQFKAEPRIITSAQGCYLTDSDGRKIFDGLSGLWTSGLGHQQPKIVEAVKQQLQTLDFAPSFQFAHPSAITLAHKIASLTPDKLNRVFYTNSGSESADTATKIARGYWRQKGVASKTKIIGRIKGYHGASWGGISFGGIGGNRKIWGQGMDADHMPHTLLEENRFTKGMPEYGAHLADELENIIALHDASNIAAVIVEPFSGSAGVIIPPQGYLRRLRQICDAHQILLIFDEVITGFGRTGSMFAAQEFDVIPDIMNLAKQLTNGVVPMGAVVCSDEIYQAYMDTDKPIHDVELPHGYTYSGHPLACAAAIACLDVLQQDAIPQRVKKLTPYFESAVHSLQGGKYITDIRNYGLAAGFTIEPYSKSLTQRPFEIAMAMWRKGFYVRWGGDTIQFAPPFIVEKTQIDDVVTALADVLNQI
ncbi:aminotransferase class III-fold pyridoxal phosphate-dependent enzyme [Parashewanella spongiae]|uniref:Aminotransferase class III-fold pyridoxal phosphate-dependent enzyme n=1 Tax=Parashewanella spongiae TaxID=342950 RepID=A0A3A6U045_9GAMM|nr:aminotransferase class III-fold pyridoxal phosphate-dependent enzyme [Parashewanella spongiae]MCL1080060.1 aminotransferase class III-fold pyridoxal phosphate-dependent enzyme [Parashewanella spongiae]RJY05982.1 aminotransferase class III-fold pyridoxal phosphate-dependent enzyme [Parashewanella spongiae]